jgi:hypothetical protein
MPSGPEPFVWAASVVEFLEKSLAATSVRVRTLAVAFFAIVSLAPVFSESLGAWRIGTAFAWKSVSSYITRQGAA